MTLNKKAIDNLKKEIDDFDSLYELQSLLLGQLSTFPPRP